MMCLCDNGHDEVCFTGRNCPVCEMERDKDKEIAHLEDEIEDLRNDLKALESEAE